MIYRIFIPNEYELKDNIEIDCKTLPIIPFSCLKNIGALNLNFNHKHLKGTIIEDLNLKGLLCNRLCQSSVLLQSYTVNKKLKKKDLLIEAKSFMDVSIDAYISYFENISINYLLGFPLQRSNNDIIIRNTCPRLINSFFSMDYNIHYSISGLKFSAYNGMLFYIDNNNSYPVAILGVKTNHVTSFITNVVLDKDVNQELALWFDYDFFVSDLPVIKSIKKNILKNALLFYGDTEIYLENGKAFSKENCFKYNYDIPASLSKQKLFYAKINEALYVKLAETYAAIDYSKEIAEFKSTYAEYIEKEKLKAQEPVFEEVVLSETELFNMLSVAEQSNNEQIEEIQDLIPPLGERRGIFPIIGITNQLTNINAYDRLTRREVEEYIRDVSNIRNVGTPHIEYMRDVNNILPYFDHVLTTPPITEHTLNYLPDYNSRLENENVPTPYNASNPDASINIPLARNVSRYDGRFSPRVTDLDIDTPSTENEQ